MTRWLILICALLSVSVQAAGPLQPLETPRAAPAFSLPAIDGSTRTLADYRGRYLLVNFWAVWCTPCRKEMPSMQAAHDALEGQDFEVVAIHVGPSLAGAKQFAEQLGLTFEILVDEAMALSDWGVMGLPTTFLVDREGRIVARAVGERDWADAAFVADIRRRLGD